MKISELDVLQMVRAGKSDSEIAGVAGVTAKRIGEIRLDAVAARLLPQRFANSADRKNELKRKKSAELAQKIRKWLEEDASRTRSQAARHFGISPYKIRMVIGAEPQEEKISRLDALRIASMMALGKSNADIAREFDVSREWIRVLRDEVAESGLFNTIRKSQTVVAQG